MLVDFKYMCVRSELNLKLLLIALFVNKAKLSAYLLQITIRQKQYKIVKQL